MRDQDMTTYHPNNKLTDAQKFQAKYPATVHAIDPYSWDRVVVDYYVQFRSER